MPAPTSRRRARLGSAAAAAVGLAVLAGCAQKVPSQEEFARSLQTSGVPAAEARCTAKAVYGNLSAGQVRSLMERGASGVPKNDEDDTDDAADRLNAAMTKCREAAARSEIDVAPTTTTTSLTPSSTVPEVTDTSGPSFNTTPDGSTTTP